MQASKRSDTPSRIVAVLVLAAALVACQPPSTVKRDASTAALESRAAQLAGRGDHAAAARAWEDAAAQRGPAAANGYLLAAAREWLAAGNLVAAQDAIARLVEPLAAADDVERTRLRAELAIAAGQPQRAIELLATPAMTQEPATLGTRARALFALGRPADAVTTLVARERLLARQDDRLANERLIVEGVATAARRGVDVRPLPGLDPLVAGWLELGRIEASAAVSPLGVAGQLQAWRMRYPAHPANRSLWREMSEQLGRGVEPSSRIALLLPLSGRTRSAGVAVQDGFLSAYYEQPQGTRPQVSVYDVAASDAASAYLTAVGDGAQVVVGPLTREEVANLAAIADGRVTTLTLNFLPEGTVTPARFYQFALSPEDEARQAARRAVADGRIQGVALAPATEWGQRVMAAFEESLLAAGGTLVARDVYAPGTTDFRDIITRLLDLRPVQAAGGRPGKVFRPDAQFVFVAAQPVSARLIRTQLRFNYAGRLPVYSTSDVYEPGSRGNIDLNGVIFPDMPWILDAGGPVALLREAMDANWPDRSPARSRLYAFGYDAYAIVAELARRSAPFASPVQGVTGRLRLDPSGRIHRDLDFVRIEDGRAGPVDAGGPPAPGT
jgi:outer membrane PBP1 activator LpoA protein